MQIVKYSQEVKKAWMGGVTTPSFFNQILHQFNCVKILIRKLLIICLLSNFTKSIHINNQFRHYNKKNL